MKKFHSTILLFILILTGCLIPETEQIKPEEITGENSSVVNLNINGIFNGYYYDKNDRTLTTYHTINEDDKLTIGVFTNTPSNTQALPVLLETIINKDSTYKVYNSNNTYAVTTQSRIFIFEKQDDGTITNTQTITTDRDTGDIIFFNGGFYLIEKVIFERSRSGIRIVRYNSSGNQVWAKYIGLTNSFLYSNSIITTNNDLIIIGSTGGEIFGGEIYLTKISSIGNVYYEVIYGGTGREFGNDIMETSDGGLFITAETVIEEQCVQPMIIKTDKYGIIEWERTITEQYITGFVTAIETDSGYTIQYKTNNGYIFVKLSNNGRLTTAKAIYNPNSELRLIKNKDSIYITAFYRSPENNTIYYTETNSTLMLYSSSLNTRNLRISIKNSFTYSESYKMISVF